MPVSDEKRDSKLLQRVMGTLNEAQRRWLVGREALRGGRGGIQRMVETSGLSKPTILKGIRELAGRGKLVAEARTEIRKWAARVDEGDEQRLAPVLLQRNRMVVLVDEFEVGNGIADGRDVGLGGRFGRS